MFSGLISIGGMGGGLFGNLSASLKPASKISKKSEQSLHAPVKRKTSSTESHKATKRKKYETSSHSQKSSVEKRKKNGKKDKKKRSRNRNEKHDREDEKNDHTTTKQNITAAAASAHGSRTAFAFFQTNGAKVVLKKDQSSSDTVREPKNPFQFFLEYKKVDSVATEADVVAARAEWNSLRKDGKRLFENMADLDTKRCGVQLMTLTRAQKLANDERLEDIKDLNERLQMTYIGRYVRKMGSVIHGRVMDIVKDTVEVKYEDGDSASIELSKIDHYLLASDWPDTVCEKQDSLCACIHCGRIFETVEQRDFHEDEKCLLFRIEVDEEIMAAAKGAAVEVEEEEDSQEEEDDTIDVTNGTSSSQGERGTKQGNDINEMRRSVECPICLCTYACPMILPCGHSYCKDCLGALQNSLCSLCRKPFDPEKDPRRNYSLDKVCDFVEKKEAEAAAE